MIMNDSEWRLKIIMIALSAFSLGLAVAAAIFRFTN
jgi:hypothetical protein